MLPEHITQAITAAGLDVDHVLDVINRTLDEDLQWGPDVTTQATIPSDTQGRADVVAREPGALAGVPVAAATAHVMAERDGVELSTEIHLPDGSRVAHGDVILTVDGPVRTLLTAERTLLNLVSQLSGVATATAAWADALEGTETRIRDTRKTVPGLRVLQKYAVRCGGGVNHRMGLGDAALIKDNHVAAAGSVAAAFRAVRQHAPEIDVEVECDTIEQVREAVEEGADLVLLDNMSPDEIRAALEVTKPAGVRTEASGGLTIKDAPSYGQTGVDYISVGALTHSSKVLDLGFDLQS